jgi:hypothetical protein
MAAIKRRRRFAVGLQLGQRGLIAFVELDGVFVEDPAGRRDGDFAFAARSNSCQVSSFSSAMTCLDEEDWEMCGRSAAALRAPVSATQRKY